MMWQLKDKMTGETTDYHLGEADLDVIWKALDLFPHERGGATMLMQVYLDLPWHKQEGHYLSRSELERIAGEQVAQRLIENGVLALNKHWFHLLTKLDEDGTEAYDPRFHTRHPEAPYKINPAKMYALENGIDGS